jgi:hypothetical protein
MRVGLTEIKQGCPRNISLTCSCYVVGQLVCKDRSNSGHQIAVNNTIMLRENLQTAMLHGHEPNCWCE